MTTPTPTPTPARTGARTLWSFTSSDGEGELHPVSALLALLASAVGA